ncbi:hypothetical protein OE699_10560 [Sedimentimonas flavescens]|uniref:Uncharacterized protein n=1 Tax=Sedimentimonas flavescens TaxID=2851012 RepID=A0ABT2ZZX5_9RHOB|nr:hypothetical protein [Sedimentimonas flavescens]
MGGRWLVAILAALTGSEPATYDQSGIDLSAACRFLNLQFLIFSLMVVKLSAVGWGFGFFGNIQSNPALGFRFPDRFPQHSISMKGVHMAQKTNPTLAGKRRRRGKDEIFADVRV